MHSITKILEIAVQAPDVDAATPVGLILDQFRGDSRIMGLSVVENGSFIGSVSKSQLYKTLSRAFALDLYSRRPISSLLDKQAACMPPELDIHSALASLLTIDSSLSIDSISVVSGGKCLGIVPVSSLLMNISSSQSELLRMLEELTARIRDEVQKAAQMQQALLPLPTFSFPGIKLAADLTTCSEVGGDFFDFFPIDCNRLCLIIADVSGHGVQSGMVTTAAKASLHTLIRQGIATPGALLSNMNEAILATTRQALLMTCLVAVISPGEQTICYANAGHNFPYLCRKHANTVEMLENRPSFPLGFDVHASFEEQTIGFKPGDTFVLYSDGINECSNGSQDYGYGQFEDCLFKLLGQPPAEWVKTILNSLSTFRGNERFEDDVTLLIAGFEDAATQDHTIYRNKHSSGSYGDFT